MTTKSEVFGSESVTDTLPPYDEITSQSIFSLLRLGNKQKQATAQSRIYVLSRIRDIVSAPDYTPSSVASIVDACAATLPAAEISHLLQALNTEGHTLMYWAIVNHRQEAFGAFAAFISEFSPDCCRDLRLACMSTNDHALFTRLNLGRVFHPEAESLRLFLHCPPDEVQVHDTGDRLCKNQFVASIRIRMFQKRLRMTQKFRTEFVAAGRIWSLFSDMRPGGWRIGFCLETNSFSTRPEATLVIKAHKRDLDCATIPQDLQMHYTDKSTLVPLIGSSTENRTFISWMMTDWLMDNNTMYVDCEGTLHAELEMTLN
ncbi:hypothetical protein EDB19DRAFT_2022034 [Suillus lakei]|nr:hypothetical protein EDB19DRAFT_2022034 [Suillus lakei]